MKNDSEVRLCKNKECQKVLPVGYKYKYCEACRNQQVENAKKGLKSVGAVAAAILSVVGTVVIGKKNHKN